MRYERIQEFREKHIPYNKIIEEMKLAPDDIIVDMGAGDGFYSKIFADKVINGMVYVVEHNTNVIKYIKENMGDRKNYKIINEDMCTLDVRGFNKIFFSTVFHDINCHNDILKFIKENSRKPVYVYLIEFNKKGEMGPPVDIRINHDQLNKIFTDAGFIPGAHMDFEYNYFDVYSFE
jgi:ubiquinone/menaquinone biosynthesis C-methylase UbiE